MNINHHEILKRIGSFSTSDVELFGKYSARRKITKNKILLNEGQTCRCMYYIISGSFYQFHIEDIDEIITDLHLPDEWMFNQQSLVSQTASLTTIRAFSEAEVVELSLSDLHLLISASKAFLQFGKVLNQTDIRTFMYDRSLKPVEKYAFVNEKKPGLPVVFPVKMIASYLKIAPETLSRVRARH